MFRVALLCTAAMIPTLDAYVRAADDDAKAIITKAIKAHGGEDLLGKMKAGQTQNKGKMKLPGLGDVEFTQDVSYLLPDKFKETLTLQIQNQNVVVTTIVNGDRVSIVADGKEVPINDDIKKAIREAQEMIKTLRLVDILKSKDTEVTVVGESKIENKPAVGVRVAPKGKKEFNLHFSRESGLIVKIEFRGVSPATQKEVTEERIILEYAKKDKDSPPMPKKVIVKHDGEQFLEAEVVEAKLLETIDETEFKK